MDVDVHMQQKPIEPLSHTQPSNTPLNTIVVVGNGLYAWTVAACLARRLYKTPTKVMVVEEPNAPVDNLGESTLPAIDYFHRVLGLTERQLMAVTKGTYKLATEYVLPDSTSTPESNQSNVFYHAMSQYGSVIDNIAFQHHLTKAKLAGISVDLNRFSLPAAAASKGKFGVPQAGQQSLPFSYAIHVDAKRYAAGMKDFAKKLGATSTTGNITGVSTVNVGSENDRQCCHIESICLDDTRHVKADLFIDCTAHSRLIDQALQVGFVDYSEFLPCDNSIQYVTDKKILPKATTQIAPNNAGFSLSFPLQEHTVNEYHYSSAHQTKEDALATLNLDSMALDTAVFRQQKSQRVASFWAGNCVAMGDAAGSLGRIAASNFHLVQSAVLRLIDLLPDRSLNEHVDCPSRDEYNNLCEEEYARVLDYHCAYFALLAREKAPIDSPFWRAQTQAKCPESLMHKMKLFEQTGRFPFYERETFSEKTWLSLFLGLGLWPKEYDRLLDVGQQNLQDSLDAFEQLAGLIDQISDKMPAHYHFLQQFCGAK
ncbi:MAG: tryptophan 7-halogenase [Aliiglaciecola sp.]